MTTEELSIKLGGDVIGALVSLPGDRIMLVFEPAFVESADRPTLSLSFLDGSRAVVEDPRSTTRRAPPYFANLLPEGRLRTYLARLAGVNETRDYPLLQLTGGDLPGAVELVSEQGPSDTDALAHRSLGDPEARRDDSVLKFSLAGVQLKFSAIEEAQGGLAVPAHGLGGDWILKLPSTAYEGVPENEISVMTMASLVGIETPEVRLVRMSEIRGIPDDIADDTIVGANALAIRRFDRTTAGGRIHTEDFAQVFGAYPDRKYARYGYGNVGRVLAAFSNREAVDQFARRLIYSAMVGNADMHLKNWSLIYRDGRTPEISPAYDLLCTVAHLPDDTMALRLGGAKQWDELTLDSFTRLADRMGVDSSDLLRPVAETVERFRDVWLTEVPHLPISERVREVIDRQLATIPALGGPLPRKLRVRRRRAASRTGSSYDP